MSCVKIKRIIFFLIILFFLSIDSAWAATRDVCSSSCTYDSIQGAIDAAVDSDEVLVSDGTYTENITISNISITIRSVSGAANTTIDGNGTGAVVTFDSSPNKNSVLDGFTIQSGDSTNGGGIICDNASPKIKNCSIKNNNATGKGGGIYLYYSGSTIENCNIFSNTAGTNGGGVYTRYGIAHLINCRISSNSSSGNGGGIEIVNVPSSLTNCLINNNSAVNGGGISTAGYPVITNCTVPDNSATGKGRGLYCPSSRPAIVNSIFWGNGQEIYGSPTVTYSIIQSGYTGTGNLSADPLFVDAAGGDYSLQFDSPAIDTAYSTSAPADDINSTARPQLSGDDIGAYEFVLGCQPWAYFTADNTRTIANVTVNFDASGSFNKAEASYSWDFGDEASDTGETTSHQYTQTGVYTVNLTMTNGCGSNILSRENYIITKPSGNTFNVRGDFSTIGEAIDASIDGDTIIAEPGTYVENIDFGGKNITVQSSAGAATTIIDGGSIDSVVIFNSGEAATSTLQGFTLQQGKADNGGGIYIDSSSPTILDCIITSNWAGSGGGIYANNASPAIKRTKITQNTSGLGGGIALYSASAQLTNCLIADNIAGTGAGIYDDEASPNILNCTFYGNTSTLATGYGMYTFLSTPVIKNSLLWDSSPEISNDFSTLSITYSDVLGGYAGTGNINYDPLLLDPAGGDYSPQGSSTLVNNGTNSGAPTLDLNGDTRDANVDIGAVEYFFVSPNDTVTVTSYSLSESTGVVKGRQYAMFGFNLTSSPDVANLNSVKIYFDAVSSGNQNDISSVSLYEDDEGNGVYDGTESIASSMTWNAGGYYELTVDPYHSIATSPGTDLIMVVTVDADAVSNNTLRFKFNNDDYVAVDSPDTVNSFTGFSGNQTYTIQPNAVTVVSYPLSEPASVVKVDSYAMFGFTLTSSPGSSNLTNIKIYFDAASSGDESDLTGEALYEDDNGIYDGSEPLVGNITWNASGYYELAGDPDYTVSTSGTDFIMAATVDIGAGIGNTLLFKFNNDDYVAVDSPNTVNSFSGFSGDTYTISDWWNANYQDRRQLTVDQAPVDYVVLLHYDAGTSPTSSAMYGSSLSATAGDDFRIVYSDTKIDRHIGSFTSTSIDIWFKVQAAIGAGGDNTNYKLYYGYAGAASPPADTDNVYGNGHKLIAHYDNSDPDGVDGESPTTDTDTSYTTGVRVQGALLIDSNGDNLKYASSDLFGSTAPDAGTIEFWFAPGGWLWTDTNQYTFFDGTNIDNFKIDKNSAVLEAQIGDGLGTTISCQYTIPGSWNNSDPHHIAFGWDWSTGNGYLFIDGVLTITDNQSGSSGATISADPRIGNDLGGGVEADGAFDEFKTWNYAKTVDAQISYYDPEPGVVSGSESELRNDAGNQTSQRADAGDLVDVNYQGRHVDGNETVTYVAVDCEYSTDGGTWYDMTTAEATENFTSNWADYTYVWDAGTDLPDTEDSSVYVRLRVNENGDNSNLWTETAFTVDTIVPGAPSGLTDTDTTNITVDLSWTKSSGDGNWYRYEIYYKACDPCTITRGGDGESLETVTEVNTQTGTISGLDPTTTYSINIWAVDAYGHAVPDGQITAATTATPIAPELQNDAQNQTAQRTDGSNLVDVRYEGRDQNGDSVTYVAVDCEYSTDGGTWYDMTSGDSTENFTSNWVDYTYVWDVGTDLPDTEDSSVYVRLKVNDSGSDSNQWTEDFFAVDAKDPGASSNLAYTDTGQTTIDLSWTKSSGDGNWYRYEIYYKACDPCTITRGDNGETLKSEVDVNTESTTLAGLDANTTYSINIWAVDNYGHVVSDSQITATTDSPDTVTTTSYSLSEPATVDRGNSYALFGFTLTSSPANSNLGNIKIYFDAVSTGDQNDLSGEALYEDDDANGIYDGTEPHVGNITWNAGGYYELTSDPDYAISTSGTDFIMAATFDLSAAIGNTFLFEFNNDDYVAVDLPSTVNSFSGFSGDTYTISDWWNANYQNIRKLTVDQAPADYVVLLHYDLSTSPTASAMYSSSLSATGGNDFRIVYDDTEIDRYIGSFTSSSIDIWFKVQAAIGAGGDNTNYKLYYGYAGAPSPPANTDNVYGNGHILIAHYDNSSPDGVDGENPSTDSGTSYTTGVRIQGALLIDNDADNLRYSSTDFFGSTAPDAGTIEFWFEPGGWLWTDNSQYTLFDGTASQSFKVQKNRRNLDAEISDSSGTQILCRLSIPRGWNNSDPHHIAFSWDWATGNGYLFIDGTLAIPDTQTSGTGATISANPRIGNDLGSGVDAAGAFDEFKTWNYAKTADAQISYYNPEPGVVSGNESELRNDAGNQTSQRANASELVDVNYQGRHVDGNQVVTYVAVDCEYSTDGGSWYDMTTVETTENFTSSWADYTYIWDAGTDLPDTEDSTVYVRLRVNENGEDSNLWTETAFTVDTIYPGSPSGLTDTDATNITIDLSWTKSSGDGNWYRYEIYYKDCDPCTITRGGAGESLEVVTDVNTQTGTISGLDPTTTYSINIWAVDAYGHAVPDVQITAVTTATPIAPELQNDAENPTAQRTDGSDLVDVRYEGRDQNGDLVTYVAVDCEYSPEGLTWYDMTTGESTENFTSNWADYTYVWNVDADLPDTEDNTVYVRLKVNDSGSDSNQWGETAFVVDTQDPGATSNFASPGDTQSTIDLSWTISSGDGNWYRYEIYYKACDPCTITRGDNGETLKSEADVNTESTTLIGLDANTTYSINIWAVDNYGHATPDTQITATTASPDTVATASYSLSEPTSVDRGDSYALFGFTLTSSPDTANLGNIKIYFDAASTGDQNDLTGEALYEDDDSNGVYDGTEPLVGTITWNAAGYYELTGDPDYTISTSATDFILVATYDVSAAIGSTLLFEFNNDDYVAVDSPDTASSFTGFSGNTYTISDWWSIDYQNRRPLTVDQALADYVVLLHYDGSTSPTANTMYSSSLSTTAGDDFRIVYNDTEIDRHIGSFTSSSIDIWFKVQTAIGAGGDSTNYKLYYGYAGAAIPPANTSNVYGSGHMLIAHYDNSSPDGVDGENPSADSGTSYTTGVRVQGAVLIDNDADYLRYSSTDFFGSSAPDTGSIEFWFQPGGWSWRDNNQYTFFEGTGTQNFKIEKNNKKLHAGITDSASTQIMCTYNIPASWNNSNLHHIAFSWDWATGNGYLFIDGALPITDNPGSGSAATIDANPRIGNDIAGSGFADGAFDEFKTWNYAKTTAAEISYYDPEPGVTSGNEETR